MKQRCNYRPMLILTVLLIALSGLSAHAVDTGKFDFYYQRIEKVEKILPDEKPTGFWDSAKYWLKKGWNTVRSTVEKTITRTVLPGQGSKLWYSEKDPTIAYRMQRIKVQSEQHLLQLMGVMDGDESKLTDGQKSLLYMYRNAQNEQLRELSKKAIYPRINVHLTDTTGFDNSKEFPHVTDDFWPMSMGFAIVMNSKRYSSPGDEKDAMSTLVHETAHCTNLTFPELFGKYGADKKHYANEILKPRAAFQEAWSQYQEILYDKDMNLPYLEACTTQFKREDPKKPGSYTYVNLKDPSVSAKDALNVEAVDAVMMYRLATSIPDGAAKVNTAFYKGNYPWRSMEGFIKGFCKLYPADAQKASEILDQMTGNKMTEAEIRKLCGNVTVSRDAEITIASGGAASSPTSEPSNATITTSSAAATTDGQALQSEYEKTYLELVKAAQEGKEDLMKRLQTKITDIRARLKALSR